MKTQNFWKTLLMSAALLISGAMVSCDKEEETPSDFEAQISTNLASTTVDAAPGDVIDFTVTANTDWTATTDDANNILTLSKSSGSEGSTSVSATISSSASYGQKATVTLTAKGYIMGFEYPVSETITFNLKDPNFVPGDGSLEHPFSVEEVIAKCNSLGADVESSEAYYIKGIVTEIKEPFNNSYGNGTFYIGDTANATEKFYVYRIYYLNNKKWTSGDTDIQVGDNVVVCSKIVNYKGNTPETVQNTGYLYSLNGVTGNGGDSGEVTEPEHAGTANDPYTVADAINKAKITGTTATEEAYYIKGLVKSITEQFSTQYGNATFTMVDEGSNNVFTAYRIRYFNNENWTTGGEVLHEGDEVIVCGQIVNYSGNTPETAQNSGYLYKIVSCTGYEEPTPDPVIENVYLVENYTAVVPGTYYMAGYYMGGEDNLSFADYPYHVWTGTTATNSGNGDVHTVSYAYNATTHTLTARQSGDRNSISNSSYAKKIEIVSAGSPNTYYIKSDGQYLYSTEASTNRRMALGDTPAPWVFSAHSTGGILLTSNNDVLLGTAKATYDLIRSYKTASASSLSYGIVLFSETDLGGGSTDPDDPGTDPDEPETPGTKAVTIADFLAASVSTTQVYELTGTVSNIVNPTYGNFDLKDETGSVYVYGLTKEYVSSNDKSFSSLGVGEGDKIKIQGYRAEYNNAAQVGSAWLIEIVEKAKEPEVEEGYAVATFNVTDIYDGEPNGTSVDGKTFTVDGITFSFAKASSATTPAWYANGGEIRLYHNGTLTVAGATITSIVLSTKASDGNELSATPGTLDSNTWTGESSSIKFSVGPKSTGANGGHHKISKLVVTYKK